MFPNQFANIQLQLDVLSQAKVVPMTAIQRGSMGTFVLVVQEDKTVRTQKVELLALEGDLQAVQTPEGALKPGQWVVTDGADRLRDNSRVEVVKTNGQVKSAGAGTVAGDIANFGRPAASEMGSTKGPLGSKTGGASADWKPKQGSGPSMGGPQNSPVGQNADPPAGASPNTNSQASDAPADRPRWMDRLPPELMDKVKSMSPEERRAFFQKLRERRQSQGE